MQGESFISLDFSQMLLTFTRELLILRILFLEIDLYVILLCDFRLLSCSSFLVIKFEHCITLSFALH
jgi:hypothetical protein